MMNGKHLFVGGKCGDVAESSLTKRIMWKVCFPKGAICKKH